MDGSTLDGTKSFCDPYVFNTAVTRAKSLVIAVGNPFLLLKMEAHFVREYGEEHNAHCWSTYLDFCIQNESLHFHSKLGLTDDQISDEMEKIKKEIARTPQRATAILREENVRLKEENTHYKGEVETLKEENLNLKQQLQERGIRDP